MADTIEHVGVLGMRWGKHKVQEQARYQAQKSERSRFQSDLKKAGKKASIEEVTKLSKIHDKNMAAIQADFKKATGRNIPSGPIGDRIAMGLGMRKDKKGVWQATPEAFAKASAIGIGLGFVSFFAEMKVREFVAKQGVESIIKSAEYAAWLKNG